MFAPDLAILPVIFSFGYKVKSDSKILSISNSVSSPLLFMDEMNLQPQRNLYQDIKDAVNNIERPDENLLGRDENCRMK